MVYDVAAKRRFSLRFKCNRHLSAAACTSCAQLSSASNNCRRTCAPIAAYSSQVQLCIDAAGGSLLNSSSGTDTEIYFLRFAGLALTTAQLLHPNTLRRNLRSTAGFRRTKILLLSKALGLRL